MKFLGLYLTPTPLMKVLHTLPTAHTVLQKLVADHFVKAFSENIIIYQQLYPTASNNFGPFQNDREINSKNNFLYVKKIKIYLYILTGLMLETGFMLKITATQLNLILEKGNTWQKNILLEDLTKCLT